MMDDGLDGLDWIGLILTTICTCSGEIDTSQIVVIPTTTSVSSAGVVVPSLLALAAVVLAMF
jgi:hypothetical protein